MVIDLLGRAIFAAGKSYMTGQSFGESWRGIPDFGIKVEVLKDILLENKMSFENGNSFWFKSSQEDIAELSKNSSVLINCHAKKKRN